jgi:aminoglycoside phosphotransferase (APT) family kinase protein
LPVHDFPTPDDRPLVDRLLSNARDELPLDAAAEMRAALSWLESNAGVVRQEVGVLCHNDFHPLNDHLSREGKACLIDWSDADIGDRHCDVGRTTALFWLAPPLARSPVERLVLRAFRRYFIAAYLGRYSREMEVETPRLQFWQTLHALRAWAQLDKLQSTGKATLGARRGAAGEVPPGLVPALREYLRDRVSPR